VIRKFWVIPFSKLKAFRDSVTSGADTKTYELSAEVEKLSKEIQNRLVSAREEIKKLRERDILDAKRLKENSIVSAHKEMTDFVNQTRQSVQDNFEQERKKIDPLVDKLANDLFAKISVF
jgi:F0F1-type ATP synthase membrane subunit b/b'